MERDPVCGQAIKLTEVKDSSVYKSSRYYFCCPICKRLFDEKPEAYADKEELEPKMQKTIQLNLFYPVKRDKTNLLGNSNRKSSP